MTEPTTLLDELQAAASGGYGVGGTCTWHGPMTEAVQIDVTDSPDITATTPACPHCTGVLSRITFANAEEFYAGARTAERRGNRDYEAMLRWSARETKRLQRCFPDTDTLINAWRQANAAEGE